MTMKKVLLTAHWSAEEALRMLEFLDELREVIKQNYAQELDDLYRDINIEKSYDSPEFEDKSIPF